MSHWIDINFSDMDIRGNYLNIHLENNSISVEIKDVIRLLKKNKKRTCYECLGQKGDVDEDGLPVIFTHKKNICKSCNKKYNEKINRTRRKGAYPRFLSED